MESIVWFRRDLRCYDHHALSLALKESQEVLPLFIFDPKILKTLDKEDKRISFIIESLNELSQEFQKKGSDILIKYGSPEEVWSQLLKEEDFQKVYFNEDYEPYAQKRDQKIRKLLEDSKIETQVLKDHVIFSPSEVLKSDQTPYRVFTPYKRAWLKQFQHTNSTLPSFPCPLKNLRQWKNKDSINNPKIWYKKLGFESQSLILAGGTKNAKARLKRFLPLMDKYHETRDFPYLKGTSFLSVDLRMGTISIRHLVNEIMKRKGQGVDVFLSEIIWREFYQMILGQFPFVQKSSFKPQYDKIEWTKNPQWLQAWKSGQTGIPIIDSAMRCLNETGLMPNRLRMVCANYFCKILLLDWKKGEAYFAKKLLDFDLAANNGGWQWSSSSGADAAPYFRIFNPYTQSEKFDPKGEFIKKWCPELSHLDNKAIHRPHLIAEDTLNDQGIQLGIDYPFPIVSYENQRVLALSHYKKYL